MRRLLIFTFLLFSFQTLSKVEKSYKIEGKVYRLLEKEAVLVSDNCQKGCEALKKLQLLKKQRKLLPLEKEGLAVSKESRACKTMGGSSIFGVDEKKNMMAFCFFEKDSSFVEYSSLEKIVKNFE